MRHVKQLLIHERKGYASIDYTRKEPVQQLDRTDFGKFLPVDPPGFGKILPKPGGSFPSFRNSFSAPGDTGSVFH